MSSENESISARLRDTRLYYDYKQTELAKVLNVSRNVYSEYENYKRVIPLKHLNSLSNFYDLSIDYLLGLTNKKIKFNKNSIDINKISNNLSEIRKENNISMREFAKLLNVSSTLVSYYENGKILISTAACYCIAKKFNISVDYLLGKSSVKHLKK